MAEFLQLPTITGKSRTESPSQTSHSSNDLTSDDGSRSDLDHLMPEMEIQPVQYHLYKRRYIGLAVLTMMTFVVAWAGQVFSPVAIYATKFFDTSLANINFLGTAGYLVYAPTIPFVIFAVGKYGPKIGLMIAGLLTIIGVWLQFAAARSRNFPLVFVAQLIHGIAQPFLISIPTSYSRLWFEQRHHTIVTAVPSLALSVGAAIGAMTAPRLVQAIDITGLSLVVACMATSASIWTFLVPEKPPTPPSAIQEELVLGIKDSLKLLAHMRNFYLQFFGFAVFSAAFQACATLYQTFIYKYGFSRQEGGNAVAIMIFAGLGSAFIFSWIVDKSNKHLLVVKIVTPLIAVSYTVLIFIPGTRSVPGLYTIYALIGALSFSILPATLEYQASGTHPVSPVVSSALCWAGGQLFAAMFVLVISYCLTLDRPWEGQPEGSAFPGLIFMALMAWLAVLPVSLTETWIFRKLATGIESCAN